MSARDYYKNLPRKYIGSGGLFLNEKGHVLIVKPSYKEPWEIPGGLVESNESPVAAYKREIKEELGLNLKPKQLLVVDFYSRHGFKGDGIMMVFFGGILTSTQIKKIQLPKTELTEFRFVTIRQAKKVVTKNLAKRIPKAMEAYKKRICLSLTDGREV